MTRAECIQFIRASMVRSCQLVDDAGGTPLPSETLANLVAQNAEFAYEEGYHAGLTQRCREVIARADEVIGDDGIRMSGAGRLISGVASEDAGLDPSPRGTRGTGGEVTRA